MEGADVDMRGSMRDALIACDKISRRLDDDLVDGGDGGDGGTQPFTEDAKHIKNADNTISDASGWR